MTESNSLFAYYWGYEEEYNQSLIRIFGLDKHNKSIMVTVPDFTPYVYLELPDTIKWTEYLVQKLKFYISSLVGKNKIIDCMLMRKKRLYYANKTMSEDGILIDKKFPYLFISMVTKKDIMYLSYKIERELKNMLHIQGLPVIKTKIHEMDASPILQLTTLRDIPTAGWINFKGTPVIEEEDRESTCDFEYIVTSKNLKISSCDNIVNPLIMGVDIEVNSVNPNVFPKAHIHGNKIFQIACVLSRQGDTDNNYKKYLLTLGEPCQTKTGEDVTILSFKTETKLLEGYSDFIREQNPQIIVGYNIFSFDIPYMIDRAKLLQCIYNFDQQGCLKDKHGVERKIKWSSSAYKNQEFQYLDCAGRLFVDLLPLVKRDYKFDNYKLKTISTYFLGQTKDPLSVKGIFKCYRIFSPDSLAICGKYCVQDSALVVKLFEVLQTWYGLCEMANTCNVPIFYLYTQGQQIKAYSQIYKKCTYDGYVVEKDGYVCNENERYTGAYVFDPEPGLYDMVVSFDFSSLYPSTIIAYNIDYSTLVNDDTIPDELCNIFEWTDHAGCLVEGTTVSLNNRSIPIEEMINNSERLLSFNIEKDGLILEEQKNFFIQGVKECIKLTLQDGTEISCTSDHRFLTSDNRWIEAQDLIVNKDKVKCGFQPPVQYINTELNECIGWSVSFKTWSICVTNIQELDYSLRLMRLLGYLLTDGSVGKENTTIYLRHIIDVENVLMDIEIVCKAKLSYTIFDNYYQIVFPKSFARKIKEIPGIIIGKKTTSNLTLPFFVQDPSFPLPLLREFVGGLFGGDGHCPTLHSKNGLSSISFSKSKKMDKSESLLSLMTTVQKMLKRFEIESTLSELRIVKNKNFEMKLYIPVEYLTRFHETIGYRYCSYKNHRCQIAYSYYKLRERIRDQRNTILEDVKARLLSVNGTLEITSKSSISIKNALEESCKKFKSENVILNNTYSLPSYDWIHDKIKENGGKPKKRNHFYHPYFYSYSEYLKEVGVYEWFAEEDNNVVKSSRTSLPTYIQTVIDAKKIGKRMTYDIEVKHTHNFVANGIIVHNCEHDTSKRKTKLSKDKVICGAYHKYRFLKEPKGVIPTLLQNLLDARKKTNKEISQLKDKLKETGDKSLQSKIDVLDKRQLSYKISANSMYGCMGVKKGYLPFMPGAMCTTARGRESIQKAANYLQNEYKAKLIYGDTDSTYISLPGFVNETQASDCYNLCYQIEGDVKSLFPSPMKLAFEEKIYWRFFILTKKRYMALTCNTEGKVSSNMFKRGVLLARRDNSAFLRNIYAEVINKVFYKEDKNEVLNHIIDRLKEMCSNSIDKKQFIITKSVGDVDDYKVKPLPEDEKKKEKRLNDLNCTEEEYKIKSLPAQVQLAEKMRRRGKPVDAGTRLEYVVTCSDGEKLFDKVEDAEYFIEHQEIIRLDYMYYLKLASNPLDQLLEVAYKINNFTLNFYKQLSKREKMLNDIRRLGKTCVNIIED